MENTNPRPKFKKVKRPIKRPVAAPENVAVPVKMPSENPFNRPASSANTGFNLGSYLEEDNLPAIQSEQPQNRLEPAFLPDDEINEVPATFKDHFVNGNFYTSTAMVATAIVCLILGIFISKVFLSAPTLVQNGLQGIVINPEVPKGKARCGVAEKTQGCVLYIMNPQRRDLDGRDFYDLASQLTERQRFVIETGNMRYSGVKIRPGEIAQINIPPLQ